MFIKLILTIPLFVVFLWAFNNSSVDPEQTIEPITSFYDHKVTLLNNEEISLDKYKGKKLLIVNVASNCGYTNQYNELQDLYETHGDKVEILGFPCNDFSIAGKTEGLKGKYGPLYKAACKVLNYFKPNFFVAENVSSIAPPNAKHKDTERFKNFTKI